MHYVVSTRPAQPCRPRLLLTPALPRTQGTLTNGNKFDSSRDRGQPFVTQIGVGRVIKGWDEGVPQLSLGQKAVLECTPGELDGGRSVTEQASG